MAMEITQKVTDVAMHSSIQNTEFKVSLVANGTSVLYIRSTDWIKHESYEFRFFANDAQLRELEMALHFHNMDSQIEKDGIEATVHRNPNATDHEEKVTA